MEVGFPLTFRRFRPPEYHFKVAGSDWELDGFWRLRGQVFCEEQALFVGSDRDEFDDSAIPIVAVSVLAGMEDRVVGVVRIDEREPGTWFGSRLGVDADFRNIRRPSRGVSHRARGRARWRIGPALIHKAVTMAHGLGCRRFVANVQAQNGPFFESLHWRVLGRLEVCGRPHLRMEADLSRYPVAQDAEVGAHPRSVPA